MQLSTKQLKQNIIAQVREAGDSKQALRIVGGNSKAFYGERITATPLLLGHYSGVVKCDPQESFLTAKAGTPLLEINQLLSEKQQMFPFEPPAFGTTATLGGCLATGLAGPARATFGAVRDATIGVRIINGRGEVLRFGGSVMKNVAGYDVSRLMCGACGTLGVILEATIRLRPKLKKECTIRLDLNATQAIAKTSTWVNAGLPLTASFHCDGQLFLRLSGHRKSVAAARQKISGDEVPDSPGFWSEVREHQHPFFKKAKNLWRLSLAPHSPPLGLPGDCAFEWGGALRWLATDVPAQQVRAVLEQHGGHACLFRSEKPGTAPIFHPPTPGLLKLHQRIKHAFDPLSILNPGKIYPGL